MTVQGGAQKDKQQSYPLVKRSGGVRWGMGGVVSSQMNRPCVKGDKFTGSILSVGYSYYISEAQISPESSQYLTTISEEVQEENSS